MILPLLWNSVDRQKPTNGLAGSSGPMGSCKKTGSFILYNMDVEPLFGSVIRGTFKLRLAGRLGWTSGSVVLNDASLSVASRATLIWGARGHKDTERGLTKVNDALFPTRSFSSICSHFLSSIISAFCRRRVSCMFCFSLCHSRWASSLLFGSSLGNSFSYKKTKEMLRGVNTTLIFVFSLNLLVISVIYI